MNDATQLYLQGLECMLEKVAADDTLLVALSTLKSRLLITARNLQTYGADDLVEKASLVRVLHDLHAVCLEHFHMDFEDWCARCTAEKLRAMQHEPLYQYIGNWQVLQDGMVQQFLREKLALQGIKLMTSRPVPVEDVIQRFRTIPLHAYLLYSSQDTTLEPYIKKHWDALEGLSKDVYDLYISVAQLAGQEDGYDVMDNSYIMRKIGFADYSLLPGLLFWDDRWNWDFLSLQEHTDEKSLTTVFRLLYERLRKNPTVATIKEVKTYLHLHGRYEDIEKNLRQFSRPSLVSLLPEKEIAEAAQRDVPSADLIQKCTELIDELKCLPISDGGRYEELVEKILDACFSNEFAPFRLVSQSKNYHGTMQRDFIIENIGSRSEFWLMLKQKQNVELILFDAKNYKRPLENDQLPNTLRYLTRRAFGNFIIFMTRNGVKDYTEVLENYHQQQQIALFLNDADVIALLERKRAGEKASSFIREKYVQFLLMA